MTTQYLSIVFGFGERTWSLGISVNGETVEANLQSESKGYIGRRMEV